MQDLYQSIVKTEQSYIDNISIKDHRQGNDLGERIQQFKNILKWVHKRGPHDISYNDQKRNPSEYSYFMVKIESITNLTFKKVVSGSKVHAILVAKLVNIKSNRHYPKVTRSVKVLQETNTYSFQLREPICLYFYTQKQAELMLKIEVLLVEQEIKNEQAVHLFGYPENAGCIEIDFLKDHKGKQKKQLTIPNQFTFYSRQGMETAAHSNAVSTYIIVKSEAYRYLESIIAEHTLCDPTDKIPGIMGYFLPLSQNALSEFALTPQAQGLQLSFTNVQINTQLIKQATVRAENLVKGRFSRINKISSNIGQISLLAKFHNGWKVISSGSTIVKERVDAHLKTNNSNISDLQNVQSKQKTTGKVILEGQIRPKIQYKRYACENSIQLSLIFPQQDECVLIYQIVADVTVRGEVECAQKKEKAQSEPFQQIIQVPLCFGINSAKSIGNYRSNSCVLNVGGCLTSFHQLKEAVQYNIKQINQLKKAQGSKAGVQSKHRIPSIAADFDNISINKTQKTLENISQMSWKNIKSEVGSLDFEMQLIERQMNVQDNMNLSLPMENISSLNVSKIDIRDKIQSQKQRIAKESKKNVPAIQKNRLDINFTKQFIISENHRNQLLSKIEPPKQSKYYAKQAFLKMLKRQVNKNYQRAVNPQFQTADQLKKKIDTKQNQQYIRMLYSLSISKLQAESIIEHRYSKYFYYLYSNYVINEKYYFKYEETPIQIIKTQLSQVNYNNCYFINFVEINNHVNHLPVKFPKVFYFKMKFFNQQCIRSELMTINKDTGEILLLNGQKSIDKILHIQVDIDQQPSNYLMKFVQFIQYLHNGILNIEIMDYFTGFLFGTFTIPLRNLIRKRRNQVIYMHEDWIYHRNLVRGNMKVEVRAIRKMKHRVKIENKSPQKEKPLSPIKDKKAEIDNGVETDKRMDRIQRFKESKNKLPARDGQSQLRNEMSHVQKIISKAYAHERTKIMVTYLKKQFFFIEIANKHDDTGLYRMAINDQDRRWIERNSLSGQQQLTIVKDPAKLQKEDYQVLTSSKKNQERMMKTLKLTEDELIQMPARAKGFLLLCYLTVRRFSTTQAKDQDLIIYNRERTINCSLINEKDGSIECISAIDIVPLPEEATIELEYYRPANEQSLIHIPFIDPQYLTSKIDQVLVDDPYVIVLSAANTSLPMITRFASLSTGIYIKLSNDIPKQSCKEYNLLLLADVKKKQLILGESRKNDRRQSRFKTQSRIAPQPIEDVSGPKMVSLILRVWGCLKFTVQVPLWSQAQGSITIPNEVFNKANVKFFFLATDDQDALKFTQDRKNKYQNLQLLHVNEGQARTEINYIAASHTPNQSYISVHAIDGSQAVAQQQSLKNKNFNYVQPFYRIVMSMQSFIPNFKEMLKINVNRASQGVMEEPFIYRSSSNKKTQFRIHSSDASLVWVKNNDTIFQIEAKGQRKIHISFHSQKIIERSGLTGTIQGVVLGVKWDRGLDYYGFKFNIY